MPQTALFDHTRRKQISCCVLACGLAIACWATAAQAQTAPAPAPAKDIAVPAAAVKPVAAKVNTPDWKDLSPAQHTALKPLAANWPDMTPAHKRKWLELSKNYASIPAAEQAKLHTRMSGWAALSPQQRSQARLNFAETKALTNGLTPEQRKAQWQAYQLLSPEEKKKLAANSQKAPVGTALAAKPTDPIRSTRTPEFGTAKVLAQPAKQPASKIAVAPHMLKSNRLMQPTSTTASLAEPASGSAATSSTSRQ